MNSVANTTIKIGRLTYNVTIRTLASGELQYLLEGKRGALYATMRNKHTPSRMFLIGAGSTFSGPLGKRTVWLSDASGSLEVAA